MAHRPQGERKEGLLLRRRIGTNARNGRHEPRERPLRDDAQLFVCRFASESRRKHELVVGGVGDGEAQIRFDHRSELRCGVSVRSLGVVELSKQPRETRFADLVEDRVFVGEVVVGGSRGHARPARELAIRRRWLVGCEGNRPLRPADRR